MIDVEKYHSNLHKGLQIQTYKKVIVAILMHYL